MGRRLLFGPICTVLLAHPGVGWSSQTAPQGTERPHTFVVCAVGDVQMGTAHPSEDYLPPDGGSGLFAPVRGLLSGDVIFGNLEGPLADGGESDKCSSPAGCYAFRTPTSYVRHLQEAGFTVMSVANNHAMDFGEQGRQSTLQTLDRAGIAHSGPLGDVASLEVHGKRIALVAFTTADHSHNLLEIDQAAQTVARLDQGFDLVLVSFHGGTEGSQAFHLPDEMEYLGKEPRGHLVQFAHAVVDAGADLVIGHGPHVLRGMEVYRRRLIAYSLGNFCTYARFNLTGRMGQAVILKAELDLETGELVRGRLQATFQEKPGGPRPDPDHRGIALVRRLSQEYLQFTAPRFEADGHFLPPPGDGAGLLALKHAQDRRRLNRMLAAFLRNGLDEERLRHWFGDRRAGLIPEVLERMARPAEKLPYEKYRTLFIQEEVLRAGRNFLKEKQQLLCEVEEHFQVDRHTLAGLIATETRFGTSRGKYASFNALATLALRFTRRSRWAQRELRALLSVFSEDPLAVRGSYAGAVGLVQFMPTSIQAYGVDFDRDGRVDLYAWNDALASAANYLKKHGWKRGQPIRKGNPNYRALYRYNPAHNYVRVVRELAEAFGQVKPKAPKQTGRNQTKKKTEKPTEPRKAAPQEAG